MFCDGCGEGEEGLCDLRSETGGKVDIERRLPLFNRAMDLWIARLANAIAAANGDRARR